MYDSLYIIESCKEWTSKYNWRGRLGGGGKHVHVYMYMYIHTYVHTYTHKEKKDE